MFRFVIIIIVIKDGLLKVILDLHGVISIIVEVPHTCQKLWDSDYSGIAGVIKPIISDFYFLVFID